MMPKLMLSMSCALCGATLIRPSWARYLGTARARLTATMSMMVPMTILIMCSRTMVVPTAPSCTAQQRPGQDDEGEPDVDHAMHGPVDGAALAERREDIPLLARHFLVK